MRTTNDTDEPGDDGLPGGDIEIQIAVSEEYLGMMIGLLNTFLGRIQGLEIKDGKQVVRATIPARNFRELSAEIELAFERKAEISILESE